MELTQKYLHTLFYYNENTGSLIWKETRNGFVKKDDIAGFIDPYGYIRIGISVNGKHKAICARLHANKLYGFHANHGK